MKMLAKNQNVFRTRWRADDALEQSVQAFDEPLQKVLSPRGHLAHVASRELSEHDEAQRHDPRDDHGVRDRETEGLRDLDGLLRQAVFHLFDLFEEAETDNAEGVHINPAASTSTAHATHTDRCPTIAEPMNRISESGFSSHGQNRPSTHPPAFRTFSAMPETCYMDRWRSAVPTPLPPSLRAHPCRSVLPVRLLQLGVVDSLERRRQPMTLRETTMGGFLAWTVIAAPSQQGTPRQQRKPSLPRRW